MSDIDVKVEVNSSSEGVTGTMRHLVRLLLDFAPLMIVPVLFVLVLHAGSPAAPLRTSIPSEPSRRDRCTWYCHNHGCRHVPVLPAFLAGDKGLFGKTIVALHTPGNVLVPGRPDLGYGAANLIVFCIVWPGGMYALYLVALRQRRRLHELRRERAA